VVEEDIAGTFARASKLLDLKDGQIHHVTTGEPTISHNGAVVSVLQCDVCWRGIQHVMEDRLRPLIKQQVEVLLDEALEREL